MQEVQEYRFHIHAFTPETIPMARLAEYMADLAALLGHAERVHFVRLEPGSTVIVQAIEPDAVPMVRQRIAAVRVHDAPPDAMRAFRTIDDRLAQDDATAQLTEAAGAEIIRFPGRDRPPPLTFGPVTQQGSLDGVLIRVGGRDAVVPVHLQDETMIHKCLASRAKAKALSQHLFTVPLRVFGNGRWHRDGAGNWSMDRFVIDDFQVLDDSPLLEIADRLRSIGGSEWKALDDPLAELARIRHG